MEVAKPISKQPIPPHATRVFKGVIFDVYQWEQEGYDGRVKIFEKLKRKDTALVIPITEGGKIVLAKQEQPGKAPFIGSIGGQIEEGEETLAAAKREMLEEAGYEATEWSLFSAVQPTSKLEWAVYTFIAKGCRKVAEQHLDGGEKIELLLLSFEEFVALVLDSEFSDPELRIRFLEAKLDPAKMKQIREQLGV
jgi:ADP-ribose pyrophosphatase